MAKKLIDDPSRIHICTDKRLPPELIGRAIGVAHEERSDNLLGRREQRSPRMAEALAEMAHPVEMAVVVKKLWKPGRVLKVRLLGKPSSFVADRIAHYAGLWSEQANIRFQLVSKGTAEIRVGFDRNDGSWSYLGTDARLIAASKPTMNYGWLDDSTDEDEFSRVVLHEFGHALGCIHEHERPDAGIPWNKPAVYEYYRLTNNWTKQDVDDQVFSVYAQSTLNSTRYDRLSIMHYAIPAELLLPGSTAVGWNRRLSASDKTFIRSQYRP